MRWLKRIALVVGGLLLAFIGFAQLMIYRIQHVHDYEPVGEIVRFPREVDAKVLAASRRQVQCAKFLEVVFPEVRIADAGWAIRVDFPRTAYIVALPVRVADDPNLTVWTWGCIDYHGPMSAGAGCIPLDSEVQQHPRLDNSRRWYAQYWAPKVSAHLAPALARYARRHLPDVRLPPRPPSVEMR